MVLEINGPATVPDMNIYLVGELRIYNACSMPPRFVLEVDQNFSDKISEYLLFMMNEIGFEINREPSEVKNHSAYFDPSIVLVRILDQRIDLTEDQFISNMNKLFISGNDPDSEILTFAIDPHGYRVKSVFRLEKSIFENFGIDTRYQLFFYKDRQFFPFDKFLGFEQEESENGNKKDKDLLDKNPNIIDIKPNEKGKPGRKPMDDYIDQAYDYYTKMIESGSKSQNEKALEESYRFWRRKLKNSSEDRIIVIDKNKEDWKRFRKAINYRDSRKNSQKRK